MPNLYRNSSGARAISKGFNMQQYEDNRRTEQPDFFNHRINDILFFNIFLRKSIFLQYQKAGDQKIIIKSSGLCIIFSNWIWNLNIVFDMKEFSFKLIKSISLWRNFLLMKTINCLSD